MFSTGSATRRPHDWVMPSSRTITMWPRKSGIRHTEAKRTLEERVRNSHPARIRAGNPGMRKLEPQENRWMELG